MVRDIRDLGHFITDQINDDDDIELTSVSVYVQENTTSRKFSFCSLPLKVALFKEYCTPLYTAL